MKGHVWWNGGAIHQSVRFWHLCWWWLPTGLLSEVFIRFPIGKSSKSFCDWAGVLICWTQTTPFTVPRKKVVSSASETHYVLPLLQRAEELPLCVAFLIFLDYVLLKDIDPKALQHPGSKDWSSEEMALEIFAKSSLCWTASQDLGWMSQIVSTKPQAAARQERAPVALMDGLIIMDSV